MQFSDELAVVMVMLCDFTVRKFQRRSQKAWRRVVLPESSSLGLNSSTEGRIDEGDAPVPYLMEIEDVLDKYRIKLSAAHARSRIRARVLSIESLLPSNVRQNDKLASRMHIGSWVNFCKTRLFVDQ
jgi:putative component of toxin-antitoxin plasmid stabilization module